MTPFLHFLLSGPRHGARWLRSPLTAVEALAVRVRVALGDDRPVEAGDRGQTTSEYALVLLAAASLALLLVAWAAQSGKIGTLFDTVFDHIIGQVG